MTVPGDAVEAVTPVPAWMLLAVSLFGFGLIGVALFRVLRKSPLEVALEDEQPGAPTIRQRDRPRKGKKGRRRQQVAAADEDGEAEKEDVRPVPAAPATAAAEGEDGEGAGARGGYQLPGPAAAKRLLAKETKRRDKENARRYHEQQRAEHRRREAAKAADHQAKEKQREAREVVKEAARVKAQRAEQSRLDRERAQQLAAAEESARELARFVEFVKAHKVVQLDELGGIFGGLSREDLLQIFDDLEHSGQLTGVVDLTHGRFVCVSDAELHEVAACINARGRLPLDDLASEVSSVILRTSGEAEDEGKAA